MENKKRKILIVSSQRPYYGGASTTAYNLTKLLSNNFDVRTIFLFRTDIENFDPDKIGLTYGLSLLNSKKLKRVYKLGRYYFNKKKIDLIYFSMKLQILSLLISIKFSPDLIVVNIPVYYKYISRIFKNKRIVFIVNGHHQLNVLWDEQTCAYKLTKEINDKIENRIDLFPENLNGLVLFNSQTTQDIYLRLEHYIGESKYCFFNILKQDNIPQKKFQKRKYDIAFIVSMFSRNVKNVQLAHEIFNKFPAKNKIAIGEGAEMFGDCPNTTILPLMHQKEIYEILNEVKVVLLTSYYDSSPGLQAEAILMGSNVISSKNIGWNEVLDQQSVVNNYFDVGEWVLKTEFLINNFQPNQKFKKIIDDSSQEIISLFSEQIDL